MFVSKLLDGKVFYSHFMLENHPPLVVQFLAGALLSTAVLL